MIGRSRVPLLLLVALLTLATAAARAAAQDDDTWLDRQNLSGAWRGVRPTLSKHGFEPYLIYTGSMFSNLGGGRRSGTEFTGFLDFGFDLDLARLGAWSGLGFHADWHWYQGRQPTTVLVGGLPAASVGTWEASDAFRFFNIYLRQTLDRWRVEFGQIAADSEFMLSRYAGVFINASFGIMPSQYVNVGAPVYPLAGPGVFAGGHPLDDWKIRLGAYTGDPGADEASNIGFGWRVGAEAGWAFFGEVAFEPPFALPGAYTVGGIYNTGGETQVASGLLGVESWLFYVMIDQMLATRANGDPLVGVFARFSVSPEDRSVISYYADAGIDVFGPIPSRPRDVLGIGLSVLRLTGLYPESLNPAGLPVTNGQGLLELTYQVQATPWLVVQPDLQLVLDPTFTGDDACVLGVNAVVTF